MSSAGQWSVDLVRMGLWTVILLVLAGYALSVTGYKLVSVPGTLYSLKALMQERLLAHMIFPLGMCGGGCPVPLEVTSEPVVGKMNLRSRWAPSYLRGLLAWRNGNYDLAQREFELRIQRGDRRSLALYALGALRLHQGCRFEAYSTWRQGGMLDRGL